MEQERDNNTLDNAGPGGRRLADALTERVTTAIDSFPPGGSQASAEDQRAAIARITANNLYDYAQETER